MIKGMQPRGHSPWSIAFAFPPKRPVVLLALALAALAFPAPAALAQESRPADAETAITPDVRAADDCLQNLVDQVLTLRLEDDLTTVAEFLTLLPGQTAGATGSTAQPEYELRRALLAESQQGPPRRTTGGGVELDLTLPTTRLNEILKSVAAAHLPKEKHARAVVQSSAGPTITATGRYIPDGRPRDSRPGWRHCAPDQIAQTRTAAQLDVHRRLLDRLANIRIGGNDSLRAVIARFPRFRDALTRRVDAVPLGEPTFDRIGVCRLSVSITPDQMRALVQGAIDDANEDLPAELTQADELAGSKSIVIEGFAVPPPYIPPASRTRPIAEPGRPDWADRVLNVRATAAAPPGVADPQARRDQALKAARLEAARLLWLDIEKLPLTSGTIADRLAGHPRMRETIAAIDALFLPTSSPTFDTDDRATISVGVRLEPVWQIIRNLK